MFCNRWELYKHLKAHKRKWVSSVHYLTQQEMVGAAYYTFHKTELIIFLPQSHFRCDICFFCWIACLDWPRLWRNIVLQYHWIFCLLSIDNPSNLCVSVTAVSRQPLVRSNWKLPGILLGTCGCAFSRFDINRTSASQVMAIYLPTNDKTRCCVGVADGEENLSRVPHYGLQRTDFRRVMTSCILIISRFLMRIYR